MWFILSQQNTEPYVVNLRDVDISVLLIIVISIVIYTVLLAVLFTYALIRTQTFPPTSALVSALSLLTFIALSASIVTRSQALETIAATGVGAIAGALSTQITSRSREKQMGIQGLSTFADSDTEEVPQTEPEPATPEAPPEPEPDPVVTDPEPHVEPAQAPGFPPRKTDSEGEEVVENPMVEGED